MTSPSDIASLKHEVAELWRRFKTQPPDSSADTGRLREAILEATRALDTRHRALTARRDELESARRVALAGTAARRVGFAALGGLLGAGVGTAVLVEGLEPLAAATLGLPAFAGALLLATVPALLLLRLR
ncbi:MAG: hypothetical protein JNJ54_02195 [Myxococcaceae bacterium]|nr:hypothetical protein [Myxococcaceae bacterium]